MQQGKLDMFRNRLQKVFRHNSKLARSQGVSCYRVYDRDLPEFPLIIEVYEDFIYLTEYDSKHQLTPGEHEEWWKGSVEVVKEVMDTEDARIYAKKRQRKTDRQGQYQKIGAEGQFFQASEGGLKFWINLSDYIDTGLFLDHRITRDKVRQLAGGKRVLNLFCYTGSFSVYAADGGAALVTSVDLSNTYLDWARRNFTLNRFFDEDKYQFVKADVLQYLHDLRPHSYDMIILDPPTFSNSKMMKDFFDVQRDHVMLINALLGALSPGGLLFFSTNYRKFHLEQSLLEAATVKDLTRSTTPFDFRDKLQRFCYQISI